jgi:hypothetical protein
MQEKGYLQRRDTGSAVRYEREELQNLKLYQGVKETLIG